MGFPQVVQLARLDRIGQLSPGRQEVETVWIITSLGPEQAHAARLLQLARQYWTIENGTHYRLDVSSGEDRCRVRHQRKARDSTCPAFHEQMSRRINLVIRYLTGGTSRL